MKQIVLKPILIVGERIQAVDKEWVITKVTKEKVILHNYETERIWKLSLSNIKSIIESPDAQQELLANMQDDIDMAHRKINQLQKAPDEEITKVADTAKVMKPPLNERMGELYAELSGVYSERAKILAAFAFHLASDKSGIYKVGIAQHPLKDKDWDDNWRTILVIELPEQIQMTWHFSDDDKYLLSSLSPFPNYKWDGHTTEEKYKRLIDWFLPVTVSSQQKIIKEEKAALKLRVGGVYRNNEGDTDTMMTRHDGIDYLFAGKSGRAYKISGVCLSPHTGFNLIEEVQPKSENLELSEFTCAKCDAN